jgi:pimeloyl-ACP methyl ester carboxylesterase
MNTNTHPLLNYTVEGKGPVVILLHGLSASLKHWQLLIPELTAAGFCTVAVDLLGHGDSFKPPDPKFYTAQAVLAALEDWLDCLEIGEPFYLIGHSLGGYLGLRLAQWHPKNVRSMVLIDPLFSLSQLNLVMKVFMPISNVGGKILKVTPLWVVQTYLNMDESFIYGLPRPIRAWYAQDVKRASPHFLEIPGTILEMEPVLDQITTNTLVVWGDGDRLEDPDTFERLIRLLPNGSGCVVRGTGHQPHHTRPKAVNPVIVNYLHQNN